MARRTAAQRSNPHLRGIRTLLLRLTKQWAGWLRDGPTDHNTHDVPPVLSIPRQTPSIP